MKKLKIGKEDLLSSKKHGMKSMAISQKKTRYFSENIVKKGKKRLKQSTKKLPVSSIPSNIPASECPKSSHTLVIDKVKSSVNAMLRYNEEKSTKKFPSLFMDEKQLIYLTVECIKIPVMPKRNFRFCLPHPLVDRSSDVCLFVPDLKKGKREDHEPTKEYYNDILQKNNISGISEIMPLRQVRVEYDQYELRRRLVDQYDLFLCDGRISGHILHLLGKEVYRKRKLPVPVDFRVKNLNEQVEKAFSKTLMMMHGNGKKCSLKIGHTKLSMDQITENIMDVAKDLAEHYPGGWTNIRSLHIHMQDMPEIPVYISFKSSNEVEVPVVKPVVPKKAVPVEGELSTFPGTSVIVMPSGEVIVKKMKKTKEDIEMDISDSDWEDFDSVKEMDSEKEDSDDVEETSKDGSEEEDEKDKNDDSDSNENGYSEHLTEAAENAYLNEWSMKWNEGIKSMEKEKKRKMKNETNDKEVRKKKKKIEEQNETALDTIKQEHKNLQKERQKRDKAFKIGKKQHTVLKMENETNDKEMRKKKKAEQNKNALDITKQEPKILQKKKQKRDKAFKIGKKQHTVSKDLEVPSFTERKETVKQQKGNKLKHKSNQSATKKKVKVL